MLRKAVLLYCLSFTVKMNSQQVNIPAADSVKGLLKKTGSEYDLRNYKSNKGDRLIMEINHTGFMGLPQGIVQHSSRCIGFNVSLMFDKPLGNSAISLGYGIGLFSHNFHSNADFVTHLDSGTQILQTRLEPYNHTLKLNRYAQKILEIPLEIRFRSKTERQFKLHLGGKIGYVVNDFRSIHDQEGKIRFYDVKNINPIRCGINFRLGFEQFAICAAYYFTEIFKKNQGPSGIYPYSLGIAIIPY